MSDGWSSEGASSDAVTYLQHRLRAAAEEDDPAAWIQWGAWLLEHGRPAREYGPWLRKARGRGFGGLDYKLELRLDDSVAAGWAQEAFESLYLSGASTEVDALLRVVLRVERYRPEEAEVWYRRAAETGQSAGLRAYGQWLERARRSTEAGPHFAAAAERGDHSAVLDLARWQAQHGQYAQALESAERAIRAAQSLPVECGALRPALFDAGDVAFFCGDMEAVADRYGRAESIEYPLAPRASGSWETALVAATVSTAVVPFVQALAGLAAQGAYETARTVLRRVFRRGIDPRDEHVLAEPSRRLLIAEDLTRQLRLRIPTEATDKALDALVRLDLTPDAEQATCGTLRWNSELGDWEHHP
ncbi:hypothetical protein AB0O86_30220 [Streptomyces hirsutus]|uniref:hypothetical protein n=1 Tax=Streptomyces hirsutus TaxID=35620 RepID=UPI0034493448